MGCASVQGTVAPTSLPTPTLSSTASSNGPAISQPLEKPADLQTAEEKAGFEMTLPTTLPKNYQYRSASYIPEQEGITVQYVWNDPKFKGEMLFLTQQRKMRVVQKEAVPEQLQIGGSQGIFYQGGLFDTGWEAKAPVFTLSFNLRDFNYIIQFTGNESSSTGWITKEEMITLAEQLH
jgi:hypothetical protein